MASYESRVGQVFGKLTVLARVVSNGNGRYKCRCECGNETTVLWGNLKRGATKSCGCTLIAKHGLPGQYGKPGVHKHELYYIWRMMLRRCLVPTSDSFARYGARGISVCEEWKSDFWSFVEYMGPRPSKIHTVDRINNDGNYEPENVRWALPVEQANNHRRNIRVRINGVVTSLQAAISHVGVSRSSYNYSIEKGYAPHEALAVSYGRKKLSELQAAGKKVDWGKSHSNMKKVLAIFKLEPE